MSLPLLLYSCLFSSVLNGNLNEARLFGGISTVTVVETKLVTSWVPSSCVQVEPTLPPCRNVRYLKFPSLSSFKLRAGEDFAQRARTVHTTPLGWAEYLGLYAPTVTVSETEIRTATVQDPAVVVTFAVKGCRPVRLPLDLDRCPPERPSIAIEEILPTSTVSTKITPSSASLMQSAPIWGDNDNGAPITLPNQNNFVEPSADDIADYYSHYIRPTQPLRKVEATTFNY